MAVFLLTNLSPNFFLPLVTLMILCGWLFHILHMNRSYSFPLPELFYLIQHASDKISQISIQERQNIWVTIFTKIKKILQGKCLITLGSKMAIATFFVHMHAVLYHMLLSWAFLCPCVMGKTQRGGPGGSRISIILSACRCASEVSAGRAGWGLPGCSWANGAEKRRPAKKKSKMWTEHTQL